MPAPTPFDLNFRLLRIPVRVSPWFWLIAAMLGPKEPEQMILWIPCVFLSVLVHEFGHGLTSRLFGSHPEIALHGMGGVCSSNAERQSFWQRLAVIFAGPAAGFGLMALTLAIAWLVIRRLDSDPPLSVRYMLAYLYTINLYWSIVNLFPIWPLDGGQILGVLLTRASPRNGARWTHIVGLLGAGGLGAWLISRESMSYNGIVCLLIAFSNYQMLQMYHQMATRSYGMEDDSEWWRR